MILWWQPRRELNWQTHFVLVPLIYVHWAYFSLPPYLTCCPSSIPNNLVSSFLSIQSFCSLTGCCQRKKKAIWYLLDWRYSKKLKRIKQEEFREERIRKCNILHQIIRNRVGHLLLSQHTSVYCLMSFWHHMHKHTCRLVADILYF